MFYYVLIWRAVRLETHCFMTVIPFVSSLNHTLKKKFSPLPEQVITVPSVATERNTSFFESGKMFYILLLVILFIACVPLYLVWHGNDMSRWLVQ